MMETAVSAYWWAGPMTGIVGALLLVWALFSDRSRGRRRCPKCWYNMSGSPGLRCSECGYLASNECKLLKSRRRWTFASVAATLLIFFTSLTVAKQRQDGLWSVVPTTVLIGLLPYSENPAFEYSGWAIKLESFGVHTELRRRIRNDALADWQWEFLFWQIKRDSRFDFSTTIVAPSRWVAGEPVPFFVQYRGSENLPIWLADVQRIGIRAEPRSDSAVAALSGVITRWASIPAAGPSAAFVRQKETPILGSFEPGTYSIPIDITWTTTFSSIAGSPREVWRTTVHHDVTIFRDVDDFIEPTESSEIGKYLLSGLQLTHRTTKTQNLITLSQIRRSGSRSSHESTETQRQEPITVGATARLLFQGRQVAEFDLLSRAESSIRVIDRRMLAPSLLPPQPEDLQSGLWTVRIESDPLVARQDFSATKYWQGRIEGILLEDYSSLSGQRYFRVRSTAPMEPVWCNIVASHFAEGLAISISQSGTVQIEHLLGVRYEHGISPSEQDHTPDFVIGGTLTIYCDEQAVIEIDMIQSERWNRRILEQRLLIPSFQFSDVADARAKSWSVSFHSEPKIAMHDFNTDKYWCGSLAGQLRFVTSRSLRMRIVQGSAIPCEE